VFSLIHLLKVYFATHLIEAFTKRFDELFSEADVLAMECAFSDNAEEAEKSWNEVSTSGTKASVTAEEHMREFNDALLNRLTLKQKQVTFEKSRYNDVDKLMVDGRFRLARQQWACGEKESAVRSLDKYMVEFALQSVRRDVDYSSQLQNLLMQEPEKAVLCIRGPVHYDALPILLVGRGVNFTSYLFTKHYVHPFGEAVVGKIIHGEVIDDETLTRLHIYHDFLEKAGVLDYKSRMKWSKKAVCMTTAEIGKYVPLNGRGTGHS
jgi:hypothetical protein